MPKNLPAKCKVCGRKRRDGVYISRRGYCAPCGTETMVASLTAMGVAVEKAKRQVARSRRAAVKASPPEGVGGSSPASTAP